MRKVRNINLKIYDVLLCEVYKHIFIRKCIEIAVKVHRETPHTFTHSYIEHIKFVSKNQSSLEAALANNI